MSDTPRTDANIALLDEHGELVRADLSRQLERIASGYRGLCNPMTMSEESFQKLRALDKQFDAWLRDE